MDTQTCKTCHTEKPVTEYHRRGAGHLKRCKVCVNAAQRERYAKSGRARTTETKIRTMNDGAEEAIKLVEQRLRMLVTEFTTNIHEADDLYSHVLENLLSTYKPNDKPFFLVQKAKWICYEYMQKVVVRNNITKSIDSIEEAARILDPLPSVEETIIASEISEELKAVIEQLSPEYQQVVRLLSVGLTQREIARRLNISEQAVSQKIKRIGIQMLSLGFQPV